MSMRPLSMLCLLLSISFGLAARLLVNLKKTAAPAAKRVVVVEFGGSGCKVVVYSGNEYLEPDPTKGFMAFTGSDEPNGDGVLNVPGFSKKSPIVLIPETAAENIQKVITDNGLDGEPMEFFVSGGHISKYPRANPLCDPDLDSYVAKNCVPDSVTATRDLLQATTKKIIAIETDEAKAEAMSVMAGFGHVTGALPKYPVLILLGGSTSSQLVYISSAAATPVSSTFIMQNSQEKPYKLVEDIRDYSMSRKDKQNKKNKQKYKTLVEQKLVGILNGGSPKSVFFCSNFAFALVRPALTSDDTFSDTYFHDDPVAKAGVTEKYKPNQATALTFMNVAYSLSDQFPAYDSSPKVWTTLRILLDVMAQNSVGKDATFHIFKELTKSGNIVKVGASHGVAMQRFEKELRLRFEKELWTETTKVDAAADHSILKTIKNTVDGGALKFRAAMRKYASGGKMSRPTKRISPPDSSLASPQSNTLEGFGLPDDSK